MVTTNEEKDQRQEIVAEESDLVWEYEIAPYVLRVTELREGLYHPYAVRRGDNSLVESFGAMSEIADARRALKVWYHDRQQDLRPGEIVWIDRELLEPHPVNSRIYYSGGDGELRRRRDVEKRREELVNAPYERTIAVTTAGLIVAGNIHWFASEGLEGFKKLKCEVRTYNQAEEVQSVVLENASKDRSLAQKQAEALAVLHAQKVLAQERAMTARFGTGKEKQQALAEVGIAANKAAQILKENHVVSMSGKNLAKLDFVEQRIRAYKSSDPATGELLTQIKEKSLESAHSLLKDVPESHRQKVAQKAITEDLLGGGRGKKSVKKIFQEIRAEELSSEVSGSLEGLFAIAEAKGDEPDNNRLTPPEIIELVKEFYPDGFIDVFSELEKANIPAKKHISIVEDAYVVDWDWDDGRPGQIYSNIPWNQPGQVFARLEEQVKQGKVIEAVLVASNTILHNAVCQNFIAEHSPVVIPWRRGNGVKRLEFAPGSYLLRYNPQAAINNSNKDVIFLYYGARTDAFKQLFGHVGVPLITEATAVKRVFEFWEDAISRWHEGKDLEFKGLFLSYYEDDEGLFRVKINGEDVPNLSSEEEVTIKATAIAYAIINSEKYSPFNF